MFDYSKKKWRIIGDIVQGLIATFLLFDAVIHILNIPAVQHASIQLGIPPGVIVPLGFIELMSVLLYLIPSTSMLGALLLTGYLGGAVATNVFADTPLFSNILFPVYMGIIIWGAFYIRDGRIRELIPFKK
jgi:hypothetical protein